MTETHTTEAGKLWELTITDDAVDLCLEVNPDWPKCAGPRWKYITTVATPLEAIVFAEDYDEQHQPYVRAGSQFLAALVKIGRAA